MDITKVFEAIRILENWQVGRIVPSKADIEKVKSVIKALAPFSDNEYRGYMTNEYRRKNGV